MPVEMTPNARLVYETILGNPVFPKLLRWTLAEAVHQSPVTELTVEELQSIYDQLKEDASTEAGGFK